MTENGALSPNDYAPKRTLFTGDNCTKCERTVLNIPKPPGTGMTHVCGYDFIYGGSKRPDAASSEILEPGIPRCDFDGHLMTGRNSCECGEAQRRSAPDEKDPARCLLGDKPHWPHGGEEDGVVWECPGITQEMYAAIMRERANPPDDDLQMGSS